VRLPRRVGAAIALLIGAWVVSPSVMPLYDGPGAPDMPYRYVVRPAGDTQQTPAPTDATASIVVRNGVSTAAFANSQESCPQISVYIPAGSLRAPAGATQIQLSATPSAPKAPLPTDGTIVSNVYTITATASGGSVAIIGKGDNQTPTLQMRAPSTRQPGPTFETFDGKNWKSSETIRVGQDIYQTFAPKLGVWALVQQRTGGGGSGLGGAQLAMLVIGIAILVVVGIILVVRLARSPAEPPARSPGKRAPARR
jgi:hypothetical protein